MGAEVQFIINTLSVIPEIESEGEYAQTLCHLAGFYEPKANVTAERYTFRHIGHASDESRAEYVAVLRGLAGNCQFGSLTDELIRDQVAECTLHPRLRNRFLQDSKLTLDTMLSQAEVYETSQRLASMMTGSSSHEPNCFAKVFSNSKQTLTSQDSKRRFSHCEQQHKTQRAMFCPARQA